MIFMSIGLVVLCIAGFYIYYFLIAPKMKADPNKGFEEIEAQYPPREKEKDNLAFGALFINGNASEPTRSLHMTQEADHLKAYDLKKSWGITDEFSAKAQLDGLADLQSTKEISLSSYFTEKQIDIWRRTIEKNASKEEMTEAANVISQFPANLSETLYKLAVPGMKYSYMEIMTTPNVTAWDIERLAGLARKCFHAGYISEDECYDYLQKARALAVANYRNWRHYFSGYMIGRGFLYGTDNIGQWTYVAKGLFETPDSIWNETAGIWA